MKRLLALLVAIGLVVGAVVVRGMLDDDSDGAGTNTEGDGNAEGALVVVCVSELAPACEQLAAEDPEVTVRIEEAQTTLELLTSDDFDGRADDFDAWLTVDPYPAMAAQQRQRALLDPSLGDPSPVLARSPLVIVGWNDRLAPLGSACPDATVTWRCIGEKTAVPWPTIGGAESWGVVKPGQPSPGRTASGLLTLAQASASWFGTSAYAANDFVDPAFRSWFDTLERGIPYYPPPPRTPLDEMLSKGPSTFDVAGSIEAIATPAVARSRDKERLSVLYPSPLGTADVVLVPLARTERSKDVVNLQRSSTLSDALTTSGWRVQDRPVPNGADPDLELPADNGLPKPGVLEALRYLWLDVVR